jgi:hypothetical protein
MRMLSITESKLKSQRVGSCAVAISKCRTTSHSSFQADPKSEDDDWSWVFGPKQNVDRTTLPHYAKPHRPCRVESTEHKHSHRQISTMKTLPHETPCFLAETPTQTESASQP